MDPKERSQAGILKILAMKKAKELSGDSKWDLVEQIAQEIQAHYILNKQKLTITAHAQNIKEEIKARYSDQPEVVSVLLDAVPSNITLSNWRKKKEWEEAVWSKLRGEGLFTPEQRSQVINKLFDQASSEGNVQAAKIWLTLSGDYVEKGETGKNDTLDLFREINQVIHGKK